MNATLPAQIADKLSTEEQLLDRWDVDKLSIYATSHRLLFLQARGKKVLDASYGEVEIRPSKQRNPMFLILGILLTYLGFFTRSFGPLVGILGALCVVVFIFYVEKQFLFNMPGRRPVVIKQNIETQKIVDAIRKIREGSRERRVDARD